jgi:hypothetical protein
VLREPEYIGNISNDFSSHIFAPQNPPADPSQPKFSAAISALAAEIAACKARFPVRKLRKQGDELGISLAGEILCVPMQRFPIPY